MALELTTFDVAEHLSDDEGQQALLDDAFASGDHRYIAHAIGIVARAQGMTKVASESGMQRQALYRAFSRDGNPTLENFLRVLGTLGYRLQAVKQSVLSEDTGGTISSAIGQAAQAERESIMDVTAEEAEVARAARVTEELVVRRSEAAPVEHLGGESVPRRRKTVKSA